MLTANFKDKFWVAIQQYEKINIFCHINPDYDTLGSGYGLKEFLKINYPNKIIEVVDTNKITNIHNSKLFHFETYETPLNNFKNSLGIVVDVANVERILGGDKLSLCQEIITIDHHILNSTLTNLNWIEPEYPACCQMVAELIQSLVNTEGMRINSLCVTYLYIGLLTDTNRFLYDSVKSSTYEITSWLIANGAQKKKVHEELYIRSINDAKRRAKFLNLVKINNHGVGYLLIPKKYNKKYKMSSFYDAVSIMEGFNEIKVWISCYYNFDYQTWNCSLRSREYPVIEVALKYGGGGHNLAAGCRINNPKILTNIIQDLNNLIDKYDNSENF